MLRRGDGVIATPDSRHKERLFGQHGPGRSKALSTGLKLEILGLTTTQSMTHA